MYRTAKKKNPSVDEEAVVVLARSTQEGIVVNLASLRAEVPELDRLIAELSRRGLSVHSCLVHTDDQQPCRRNHERHVQQDRGGGYIQAGDGAGVTTTAPANSAR